MQESGKNPPHIMPVVVLKVVRTINGIELTIAKGRELARIAQNVG
jgi:hypothetical protein